jgi:L-seryl-tRNA(Ser) seleniumtransferase
VNFNLQKPESVNQNDLHDKLAEIPSVEEILEQRALEAVIHLYSRKMIVPLIRVVLEKEREDIINGSAPSTINLIVQKCLSLIREEYQSYIRPVINGTGVILHTNLGRAIIGDKLINATFATLKGFSNLEYNLFLGTRGKRGEFAERMLAIFSQAEQALIINNNAAAVFLILKVLARGKEVIISRGELVQIGGGFRIPDILRESGAILKEVGTTNQTNIKDYIEAISEKTGLLLKVHQSNFSINGFSQSVDVKELKILSKKYQIPLVVDLGSGSFLATEKFGLEHEPMVHEIIRAGADIVCFSGDKLLGGPQGGIICGKSEYLKRIRKDPMYRTFRVGKMTLSLLQSVVLSYLNGNVLQDLPAWQMIAMPYEAIKKRSQSMANKLKQKGIDAACHDGESVVGGGSLPGKTLPTRLVYLKPEENIEKLDQNLRLHWPAVLGRVKEGYYIIDLRTVFPENDRELIDILIQYFK